MSIDLPQPGGYRTTQQISELQVRLGMVVDRILREIETSQNKIAAVKQEVASRWKTTVGVSQADRNRMASNETSARVREVIDAVVIKLDDEFQRAKEIHFEIEAAKAFYPGKMQFLMNATIMNEKRANYASALKLAGPMELAGYASYAIGVQDYVMAAAVIQANDALPTKDRKFRSTGVAERINIPAWESLQQALKLAHILWRQAEVAVRTFKSGKPSPIDTIRLAMLKGDLNLNEDGSIAT